MTKKERRELQSSLDKIKQALLKTYKSEAWVGIEEIQAQIGTPVQVEVRR